MLAAAEQQGHRHGASAAGLASPSPVGAVVKARLLFETGAGASQGVLAGDTGSDGIAEGGEGASEKGSKEGSNPESEMEQEAPVRTRRVLEWDEVFWGRRVVQLETETGTEVSGFGGASASAARASVLAVRSGTAEEEEEAEGGDREGEHLTSGLSLGRLASGASVDPGEFIGVGGVGDLVQPGLGLALEAGDGDHDGEDYGDGGVGDLVVGSPPRVSLPLGSRGDPNSESESGWEIATS